MIINMYNEVNYKKFKIGNFKNNQINDLLPTCQYKSGSFLLVYIRVLFTSYLLVYIRVLPVSIYPGPIYFLPVSIYPGPIYFLPVSICPGPFNNKIHFSLEVFSFQLQQVLKNAYLNNQLINYLISLLIIQTKLLLFLHQ